MLRIIRHHFRSLCLHQTQPTWRDTTKDINHKFYILSTKSSVDTVLIADLLSDNYELILYWVCVNTYKIDILSILDIQKILALKLLQYIL